MKDYTPLQHELAAIVRRAPDHEDLGVDQIANDARAAIMGFAVNEGIDCARAGRAGSQESAYIRDVEDSIRRATPDKTPLHSYAAAQGLGSTMFNPRFDGTWCLWQHRSDGSDRQVLTTRCAVDSTTYLHHRVSEIFSLPERRNTIDLLARAVTDWHATVRGYTTEWTLTTEQLKMLARDSRPLMRAMGRDALQGDRQHDRIVRSACSDALQKDERTYDRELLRAGEAPAHGTWSLWTSKGHPADQRLVVTRTALDALSYHQSHPNARSHYVAFDGDQTPARDKLIERAVALMPARSTVIVATDRSREAWELSEIVQGLAATRPGIRVERDYPSFEHIHHCRSWQQQVRHLGQRDVETVKPAPLRVVQRTVTLGPDR